MGGGSASKTRGADPPLPPWTRHHTTRHATSPQGTAPHRTAWHRTGPLVHCNSGGAGPFEPVGRREGDGGGVWKTGSKGPDLVCPQCQKNAWSWGLGVRLDPPPPNEPFRTPLPPPPPQGAFGQQRGGGGGGGSTLKPAQGPWSIATPGEGGFPPLVQLPEGHHSSPDLATSSSTAAWSGWTAKSLRCTRRSPLTSQYSR